MEKVNLYLRALLAKVEGVVRGHGIERFRLAHKRNARGELVVAVIVPDERGTPLGSDNVP